MILKKIWPFVAALSLLFGLSALTVSETEAYAVSKEPVAVVIDTTYLKRAVVSELPVTLKAAVRNDGGMDLDGHEIRFSVTEGNDCAEVRDGDQLFVKAAGSFTVKAELAGDAALFAEFTGTAYEVVFSNVRFNNQFENVTVYTQPMLLSGNLQMSGLTAPDNCHYELRFRVLSGPAEIFAGNYLRVQGKGSVTVEASSVYDAEAKAVATFEVTDPDENSLAGEETFSQKPVEGGDGTVVLAVTLSCAGALLIAGAVTAVVLVRRRAKRTK